MYKGITIFNEETIKELKVHAVEPKKKKFFIISSIICSIIGVLELIIGLVLRDTVSIMLGIFIGVLVIILIGSVLYAQSVFQTTNMEMLKEVSETNSMEIEIIFNEDNVVVNNLTTSAKIELRYESFSRFVETSSMYVLFTGSSQQVFIQKKCLNDEELSTFKEFIKEKCKNMKW